MDIEGRHKTLVVVVIIGCIAFQAFLSFACFMLYQSFKKNGMPVWSGNKVVATVDPTFPILGFLVLGTVVGGLIVWRAVVGFTKRSK